MHWTNQYTVKIDGAVNFIQTKHDIKRGDIITFKEKKYAVIKRNFKLIKRGLLEVMSVEIEVKPYHM